MPLKWLLCGLVISQTQAMNLGEFLQEAPKSSPWIAKIQTQKQLAETRQETRSFSLWEMEGSYEGKSSLDSRLELQILKSFSLERLNKTLAEIKKESARIQLLKLKSLEKAVLETMGLSYVEMFENTHRQQILEGLLAELQKGLKILHQRSQGGAVSRLQVELLELRMEEFQSRLREIRREEVELSESLRFLSGSSVSPKKFNLGGLEIKSPSVRNRDDLNALNQEVKLGEVHKRRIQQELSGSLVLGAGAAMNPSRGQFDETVVSLGYQLPRNGEKRQALSEWRHEQAVSLAEAEFEMARAKRDLLVLQKRLEIVEKQLEITRKRADRFESLPHRLRQAYMSGEISLSEWLDGVSDAMKLSEESLNLQVEKARLLLKIQTFEEL